MIRPSRSSDCAVALCAVPMLGAMPLLLRRMKRDLRRAGRLRASTAALMWSTYGAYAALDVAALGARPGGPPLPAAVRLAAGCGVVTGATLTVASMRRFAGAAQLTGTAAGDLVTGGVYRYSRNPQYAGLVALLTSLAVARRSPTALALTAGLAATYRAWVPAEEQHLARNFGDPYVRYRAATHRWLGPAAVVRSGAAAAAS